MDPFLQEAIKESKKGLAPGGNPSDVRSMMDRVQRACERVRRKVVPINPAAVEIGVVLIHARIHDGDRDVRVAGKSGDRSCEAMRPNGTHPAGSRGRIQMQFHLQRVMDQHQSRAHGQWECRNSITWDATIPAIGDAAVKVSNLTAHRDEAVDLLFGDLAIENQFHVHSVREFVLRPDAISLNLRCAGDGVQPGHLGSQAVRDPVLVSVFRVSGRNEWPHGRFGRRQGANAASKWVGEHARRGVGGDTNSLRFQPSKRTANQEH